ncbi:BID domain-containing T4SS effector [Bartonella sp. CB189]|uniref:BID domain-containing T4SS effector n=1 Tax=Bartonella sp. CB189 TaxID=3112254 RepID=UPI002F9667D7
MAKINTVTHEGPLVNFRYPGSPVMKNKYGITNPEAFEKRYARDVEEATVQLYQEPLPGKIDIEYLQHIHRKLFNRVYEWAGETRNSTFTFSDGSKAAMPLITKDGVRSAKNDEIRLRLRQIDKILQQENGLQGLSRENFIHHAKFLFSSLIYVHPFVEGNKRAQLIFFDKLAESAGHSFNFDLLTQARIDTVWNLVEKYDDSVVLEAMLEDVSNPDKVRALSEFVSKMRSIHGDSAENFIILGAQGGKTYQGTYLGEGVDGFALDAGNGVYIVGNSSDLTPEQRRALKIGDTFTFTAPKMEGIERPLIPAEHLPNLTEKMLDEGVAKDIRILNAQEKIMHLSKTVFGRYCLLKGKLDDLIKNPDVNDNLGNRIITNPKEFGSLAGWSFLGIKSVGRQEAEETVWELGDTVRDYINLIRHTREELSANYKAEQNRRGQEVKMPSKELQEVIFGPQNIQQEAFDKSPPLRKELEDFMNKVKGRLSQKELKDIKDGNYGGLSHNSSVSINQAKKIVDIAKQAGEVHEKVRDEEFLRAHTFKVRYFPEGKSLVVN